MWFFPNDVLNVSIIQKNANRILINQHQRNNHPKQIEWIKLKLNENKNHKKTNRIFNISICVPCITTLEWLVCMRRCVSHFVFFCRICYLFDLVLLIVLNTRIVFLFNASVCCSTIHSMIDLPQIGAIAKISR